MVMEAGVKHAAFAAHAAWHGMGLVMLALAWTGTRGLLAIKPSDVGHEPAIAYLLALVTFLLASGGLALTMLGRQVLRRIVVAESWLPHEDRGSRSPSLDQREAGGS